MNDIIDVIGKKIAHARTSGIPSTEWHDLIDLIKSYVSPSYAHDIEAHSTRSGDFFFIVS